MRGSAHRGVRLLSGLRQVGQLRRCLPRSCTLQAATSDSPVAPFQPMTPPHHSGQGGSDAENDTPGRAPSPGATQEDLSAPMRLEPADTAERFVPILAKVLAANRSLSHANRVSGRSFPRSLKLPPRGVMHRPRVAGRSTPSTPQCSIEETIA
jgi:hypothetical protein